MRVTAPWCFAFFVLGACSSSTTGSDGGSLPDDGGAQTDGPPHVVGACDQLGTPGKWENITPAALHLERWCSRGAMNCPPNPISTYGAHALAVDPVHAGTVYLGTDGLGFWKSLNCGKDWVKINTGTGQQELDSGRNWTIVVDPMNTEILYTTPGYGMEGLWKSVNGGVDWKQKLTANVLPHLQYGGFLEKINMDPGNHLHLTASMHSICSDNPNGGGDWPCLVETRDGGETWTLTNSAQGWSEGDGQTMLSDKVWLFGNGGGIWRTTNGGGSWDPVYTKGGSGDVFPASDGSFYVGSQAGMLLSPDGITWTPVAGAGQGATVNGQRIIASDGVKLYTSSGQYGGQEPAEGWYTSTPVASPNTWAATFDAVKSEHGGSTLAIDLDHKILYSTNLTDGMFRVVLP